MALADRKHKHHSMHDAEQALIALGFKHAPIQAYATGELDRREVCSWDDPGCYYILGCDDNIHKPNLIELYFWNVEPVAVSIGWKIANTRWLPVVEGNGKMIAVTLELLDGR